MLHCPTGAFVHIMDAFAGQTFTTDSPCPHPNYQSNKGEPVAIDPIQRVKCAPKSIVTLVIDFPFLLVSNEDDEFGPLSKCLLIPCPSLLYFKVVQQLCQGMNTCDVVRKLSRTDSGIDCQHVAALHVNYTCFPAYAQQEVVCADSYVELSCKSLGSEATLLLLHAKLDSNPKTVVDSQWNGKTKHCTDSVEVGM
ncbi:hypothetical protein FBUS_03634 [Fasciolopsis buskii]|uniref:SUEL-type lectin domain-containing protein n=1 Tax=Fasciolopsis buskii TaxID=27845 RepID=A0A8E0S4M6_9TREM|nr:hypothetical protein FBUS_03634 [Fasciolopsis buski]